MKTTIKVGIFTLAGLLMIGAMTVFVNDRPFWWRSCQPIFVNIDDATGLKGKSPIRSLGLEIGYLKSVELSETYVRLGICITAPVQVLPSTRAYIRAEGFLGDKFVELKPVRYIGSGVDHKPVRRAIPVVPGSNPSALPSSGSPSTAPLKRVLFKVLDSLVPSAWAQAPVETSPATVSGDGKDIPVGEKAGDVQAVVDRVNGLVKEMTHLTTNLKDAINPDELRQTMRQLNKTLENASKTLSPEGGLNTTAQRTLSKLEDAIEQMRDIVARINRGEGSVGKVLNDPVYADELREALRNINKLLNRVGQIRIRIDMGVENLPAYNGGRGFFKLSIWPARDRYYLLGLAVDPRGRRTIIQTKTTVGNTTTTVDTVYLDPTAFVINAMIGKVFWNRIDVSAGALNGDGAVSLAGWLGPVEKEEMLKLRVDGYSRGQGAKLDTRITALVHPLYTVQGFSGFYLNAGIESLYQHNGKTVLLYGGGLSFDDEDIRMLFAFF